MKFSAAILFSLTALYATVTPACETVSSCISRMGDCHFDGFLEHNPDAYPQASASFAVAFKSHVICVANDGTVASYDRETQSQPSNTQVCYDATNDYACPEPKDKIRKSLMNSCASKQADFKVMYGNCK